MNTLNPNALNAWIFGAAIGYAIGGTEGLAIGLAAASGFTLFFSIIQ